jgi:hypothetical protein
MKIKRNKDVKTFNLTNGMIGDLVFMLKIIREKQMEVMFWQGQLRQIQGNIANNFSIDQSKYSIDWGNAYKTAKLVCTKMPEQPQKEGEKNGENKKE